MGKEGSRKMSRRHGGEGVWLSCGIGKSKSREKSKNQIKSDKSEKLDLISY